MIADELLKDVKQSENVSIVLIDLFLDISLAFSVKAGYI
jgi:hypothetical protein